MKRRQLISVLMTALTLLAMPSPSVAWQFSFNVPVELKDIDPRYKNAKVVCKVQDANAREIGRHTSPLYLTNRSFSAVVSVPVTPIEGKTVADGARYFCDIILCTGTEDSTCAYASGVPNVNQPGTPFTPHTHANIP